LYNLHVPQKSVTLIAAPISRTQVTGVICVPEYMVATRHSGNAPKPNETRVSRASRPSSRVPDVDAARSSPSFHTTGPTLEPPHVKRPPSRLEGEHLGGYLVEAREPGREAPRGFELEAPPCLIRREPRVTAPCRPRLPTRALLSAAAGVAADVEGGEYRGGEHGPFEDGLVPERGVRERAACGSARRV
jgi:hypothetical protein